MAQVRDVTTIDILTHAITTFQRLGGFAASAHARTSHSDIGSTDVSFVVVMADFLVANLELDAESSHAVGPFGSHDPASSTGRQMFVPRPWSVIMIYLAGGLAHQDTFDLKLEAPDGIPGEFKPIATRLPGVQISEHLPRIAGLMDKVAVIRSLVGLRDEHSSFQKVTGYPMGQSQREGKPSFGSVIARVQGSVDPVVPPFVDLFPVMKHRPYNTPGPGFLGHTYKPARMEGDDLALLKHPADVPPPRFNCRRSLLGQFDQFRRCVDNAEVGGMDSVYRQGVSALIDDIHIRGLDRDVTVVVWGEFGRTPKINKAAGRDHWSRVNSALLFGGGMKVGQVIGSTDKLGGSAASRPVPYQDVLATIYHNLGIDPHAFIQDKANRPVALLPGTAEPIHEFI
jgi:Protein of unknown function (DUF1501)